MPPHSVEAEQSVLGGLLLDNQAFDRVADLITASDFYRDDHRRIWRHRIGPPLRFCRQQLLRVGVLRVLEHRTARADLDDLAIAGRHDRGAAGGDQRDIGK